MIYHGQCRDGWAAAWAAKKAMPDAELRPAMYGQDPPTHAEVAGRKLYVVDFCYTREQMKRLASSTHVIVLDHHKTAEAALSGLNEELNHLGLDITVVFDMNRSGAGIAWDELLDKPGKDGAGYCLECGGGDCHHKGCPNARPWLIDYVEDRDLWRWQQRASRLVNAYISTLPYGKPEDIAVWDEVAFRYTVEQAIEWGVVAQQAIQRYVENVADNAIIRRLGPLSVPAHFGAPADFELQTFDVPSVNAPQHDISEVLERLLDLNPERPFVHGWWQRADGMFAQSFRSRGEFDVSVIAKHYGGGGHKNAAGAQTKGIL